MKRLDTLMSAKGISATESEAHAQEKVQVEARVNELVAIRTQYSN